MLLLTCKINIPCQTYQSRYEKSSMINKLSILLKTEIHQNEKYVTKTGKYIRDQNSKIRRDTMYTGILMMCV